MIFLLLLNKNLYNNYILIGAWLILSCTLYYLKKRKKAAILLLSRSNFTIEDIESISNENAVTVFNGDINDIITDDDFDLEVFAATGSVFDSESDSDIDIDIDSVSTSVSDNSPFDFSDIMADYGLTIFPDVDFNICSIQELKLFEIRSLFATELEEHQMSDEDILEIISWFSDAQLASLWINDFIFWCIITVST